MIDEEEDVKVKSLCSDHQACHMMISSFWCELILTVLLYVKHVFLNQRKDASF